MLGDDLISEAIESPTRARLPLRNLIVDDNKPFAETLSWVLQGGGNRVKIAHNGPVALEVARDFQPDVVFLDIVMPVMDGYEVCRRLRSQATNPDVKIVALSGYDDLAAEAEKRKTRFDMHFTKPLDIRQIVHFLGNVRRQRLKPDLSSDMGQ